MVLVLPFDESATAAALKIGSRLRKSDIPTEIYFEAGKFKNKLSYANKLGVKYAVIVGEDELKGGFWTLKDMINGGQERLSEKELIKKIVSS